MYGGLGRGVKGETIGRAGLRHEILHQVPVDDWMPATEELHDEGTGRMQPEAALSLVALRELDHERLAPAELVHDYQTQVRQETILNVERIAFRIDQTAQRVSRVALCSAHERLSWMRGAYGPLLAFQHVVAR